jgi:predicted RNase H-like nuclease
MSGFRRFVVGIDGCRAGWFAVVLLQGGTWRLEVFPNVERVWNSLSDADILLIDIPIGLRDAGSTVRQCDMEARRLLGQPRASSVFPPPLRPSLEYATREEASVCNFELSGKKIGVQTWGIAPKIREIDQFLRANPDARRKIREVHPEVLFWSLNSMRAMVHNKKKREGFAERLGVLRRHFEEADELVDEALSTFRRKQVARDDILDALAAAVTGFLGCDRLAKIPNQPEVDVSGLPMEMMHLETD